MTLAVDRGLVRGLVIKQFTSVLVYYADGLTNKGNVLGTDVSGTAALGNGLGVSAGAGDPGHDQTVGGAKGAAEPAGGAAPSALPATSRAASREGFGKVRPVGWSGWWRPGGADGRRHLGNRRPLAQSAGATTRDR